MASHYVHNLNPVLLDLGLVQVRWYGLMYVVGFIIAGQLLKILIKRNFFKIQVDQIDSMITTLIVCMFLGARLFYVFIYNWEYYSEHIEELLSVWKGGLSFHGALAGLLFGGYLFARKNKISWTQVMDAVALSGTQGLFFGRIGNFINGELYGRVTDSPIGVIFPKDGGPFPRHASQLYEGFLEGVVLFLIIWFFEKRVKRYGELSAIFLCGYGIFRFIVEFFREPDSQLGYYFNFVTMGQILCFVMILVGLGAYWLSRKQNILIAREEASH